MNSVSRRRHERCALAGALAFALLPSIAWGQQGQQVVTVPSAVSTKGANASSTITSTGVFQVLFAATPVDVNRAPRRGCTIQNNGSHTMYVTEGLGTTDSTTALAVQLAAGQVYYCQQGGVVLSGEIDITGTADDAFYAAQE